MNSTTINPSTREPARLLTGTTASLLVAGFALFAAYVLFGNVLEDASPTDETFEGTASKGQTAKAPLATREHSTETHSKKTHSDTARSDTVARKQNSGLQAASPNRTVPRSSEIRGPQRRYEQPASLIADIRHLAANFDELSPDEVDELNRYLARLLDQGASAVPAIREYLRSMEDFTFKGRRGQQHANFPTLRAGLIDVLGRIGGSEAMAALTEVLATTAEPSDIAALAVALEWNAPGVYRNELLAAARQSVKLASQAITEARRRQPGNPETIDVSPLFDVMRALGDADLLSESLQDADQDMPPWKVYSMIALVQMPGGEGIPILHNALVGEGDTLSVSNLFALHMLAQAVREHPQAAEALLEVAAAHGPNIPASDWRKLAWTLRGHAYDFGGMVDFEGSGPASGFAEQQVNMPSLNLNLRRTASDPATWYPEEVDRQVEVIEQLLSMEPPEDAAYALERARDWIMRRAWNM